MITFIRPVLLASALALGAGNAFANDQTADVLHYLEHEGYMNSYPTLAVAVDGGVATITGHVDGADKKARFEQIVLNAPGVTAVRNLVSSD